MALRDYERSRIGWWALGLALGVGLVYVLYSFVGTFVFGVFIYYATRPIYRRLRRRIYPASLAAAVAIFALVLPALLLMLYALAIVVREVSRYTNSTVVDLSQFPIDQELLNTIADPRRLVELDPETYLTPELLNQLGRSIGQAADTVAFFGIAGVHLFVMVAIAFYLLRDDRRLAKFVLDRFGDRNGVLDAYLVAVDRDFKNIFFGNILNAVLTGTIGVLAYTVLNMMAPPGIRIPAAALVGLLAGVASLIPVVGMKLVYVPVTLYMAATAYLTDPRLLWFVAVFAAVSFVIVDTIPDLVLRPYVSGRSLHVGTVMVAYTLGPLLFGWYGIFLMPMVLVAVVHFGRLVLPELVRGTEIQQIAVDPSVMGSLAEESGEPIADASEATDGGTEPTAQTVKHEESGHSPSADDAP